MLPQPSVWAAVEALPARTPILPAPAQIRGKVHIRIERCKGCELCVEYCPTEVLVLSSGFNVKGYHFPEAVREEECIACHACSTICPDYAIFAHSIPA